MAVAADRSAVLQTVRGVYRRGLIELDRKPTQVSTARVLVTFLSDTGGVDLRGRGIGKERAADLRSRLKSFAGDWNRPDMDAYDTL